MRRSVPDSEKDVQLRIAHIYSAVGCFVAWLSQKRPSGQTPGIPDLYVIHPAKGAWWHEVKRAKGSRVRPAQAEFRKLCLAASVPHVIGDAEAAWAQLEAVGLVTPGFGRAPVVDLMQKFFSIPKKAAR